MKNRLSLLIKKTLPMTWMIILVAGISVGAVGCTFGTGTVNDTDSNHEKEQPTGSHPFKDLTVEEIASATVELYPPNTKDELNLQEIEDLVEILHEVVIYKEDNSYTEYYGQAVVFEITKTDGTITSINAYNPFVVIDGVGYETKYEPCEQLDRLGNNIGGTRFAY